jgi:hypothetical protein
VRTILCASDAPDELIGRAFATVVDEVQREVRYQVGPSRVALFVGSKFFFRTNDRIAGILLAVSNGATERIDLIYGGGGSGLLGAQWGAGDDLEGQLTEAIAGALRGAGLRFEESPGTPEGPSPPGSSPLP